LPATSDQIASRFINKTTVKRRQVDILENLGLRDRVDLTRYAIQRGLVRA
jgi:DNA-binding NarL/FixJ family response regulator